MTRLRANPAEPVRADEERVIARTFTVPDGRTFSLSGSARLDANAPDATIDAWLGVNAGPTDVVAASNGRLPGALDQRASTAIDGDPRTRWSGAFLQLDGTYLEYRLPQPITFDRMDLQVVADGRHSVPTKVVVEAGGQRREVDVPPVTDGTEVNGTATVPLTFPALTGNDVRVTIAGIRSVETIDYYSQRPIPLPVAIAELGIPGLQMRAASTTVASECRDDLVSLDGAPVPVRVTGTTAAALARRALPIEPCTPIPPLIAGTHTLTTALGRATGVDIDRIVLASERGGAALPVTDAGTFAPLPPAPATATVDVRDADATSYSLRATNANAPFWLVIGQSQSDAWALSGAGSHRNPSLLVNGYANGWLVKPPPNTATFALIATWTPRTTIRIGIAISALAALGCLALWWFGRRRRFVPPAAADPTLASDLRTRPPLSSGTAAFAVVLAGLVAAFVSTWWLGLAVALVGAAAAFVPRGRWLLIGVTAVAFAGSFLWVVGSQLRTRRELNYAWTSDMGTVSRVALAALILLALDVVLMQCSTRRDNPSTT